MAVTKNHPINSTLKKAIQYICNPEKTDGTLLIDSYGCTPETADIEFEWTRKKAKDNGKESHLARHFIQAFEPGETTPEQAHEIGKKLADEILGGKYEYILSTHIDRGHIHNHIIFNDVNFVDYRHSHINKKWYYDTRKISDRLCEEYGLSVIPQNENKGKSYIEYTAAKQGTSYKAQLKMAVDINISRAKDFDEFLRLMEQSRYKVKRQNKNISFCADGRERYMRSKTLGDYYTVEAIKERIAGRARKITAPKIDRSINLIIDIQNCIKAQESKAYEHWVKINNLKQAAKTLNFLTENNITTYEDLDKSAERTHKNFDSISEKIKSVEKQINTTALLIKNVETYSRLKPVMEKYKKAKNKEQFKEKYRAEITLFEAAFKELKNADYPPVKELRQSYSKLTEKKKTLYEEYKKCKSKAAEIDVVKSNVETLLGASHKPSREKSAFLE